MRKVLALLLPVAMTVAETAGAQTAPVAVPSGPLAAPASEAAPQNAVTLPILGLAQVTFKVSDLKRSRAFYEGVLGLPMAFELRDRAGQVGSAYFKVNDEQYIELVPGLAPDDNSREARLVIEASDLARLRAIYIERGLAASAIAKGMDGNPAFRIVAPNGFPIDFLQYAPGSRQGRLRGKLLAPERISTHLLHAGTMVRDDATKAFFAKLGWGRMLPGTRGDYVETPASDRNLETKNPPLDPINPATRAQYERELSGAANHFSLEIIDMHGARELLKKRGGYDDMRLRTAVGNNRHWLLHLFDPDGTRVELMSKETVPDAIPSFSVMPPGPPAPPILATERGVYPWP
jgi:catechol 2,3-dioxygenase-like lactoylglutathione lyase family enzyme